MEAEARPLLDLLQLQQTQPHPLLGPSPAQVYSGEAFGLNLYVVCNGEVSNPIRCCCCYCNRNSSIMSELLCIEFMNGNSKSMMAAGKCKIHGVDQVGTVPAALTAYLAMQAFNPDLVLTAGTAGGFAAPGGAVGDVYVGSSAMNHDRRIPIPVPFTPSMCNKTFLNFTILHLNHAACGNQACACE